MATFKAAPGLNETVAQMVAPEVGNIAKRVERFAKQFAPPMKRWVSMQDDNVRDTHVAAHGQEVPGNLRYGLISRAYDIEHHSALGVDYANQPNDPTAGLPGNSAQWIRGDTPWGCRCRSVLLPTAIAERIKTGPVLVEGSTVRVVVSCDAPQVVKAEYGDYYPTPHGVVHNDGTHFMGRAAAAAALSTRF